VTRSAIHPSIHQSINQSSIHQSLFLSAHTLILCCLSIVRISLSLSHTLAVPMALNAGLPGFSLQLFSLVCLSLHMVRPTNPWAIAAPSHRLLNTSCPPIPTSLSISHRHPVRLGVRGCGVGLGSHSERVRQLDELELLASARPTAATARRHHRLVVVALDDRRHHLAGLLDLVHGRRMDLSFVLSIYQSIYLS